MSFSTTRALTSVFKRQPLTFLRNNNRILIARTTASTDAKSSDGGAPYRPWPHEKYFWPRAASHWVPQYTPQSEKQDKYEKEELYLHEIEQRMRTYDKKWSQSDRIKSLYNEFGWDVWDDRAQYTYGLADDQSLIHGPGKKIDPDHYVNAEPVIMNRKVIPPIQYMTAEQIRRSRGSLSNFREFPPEQPSIWKYWNGLSCMGVFGGLLVCKEWFVIGGHDFWDALLLWSIFGTVAAFMADFLAWWNTLISQESYDKEYFQLLDNVKRMNEKLEQLNTKPLEKQLVMNLIGHRDSLAQKVLQKTISNRIARILEVTQKKMDEKIVEEATVKKDAEVQWNREALQAFYDYYEQPEVKDAFMADALARFTEAGFAKIGRDVTPVSMDTAAAKRKYQEKYAECRTRYLDDQKEKGTLSWAFKDVNEREPMTRASKVEEYERRVREWTQGRNVVEFPVPAFN